jgi:glycerol-3-phosphate O-acyltransferase
MLIRSGVNVEFFPEGTRSRTGKAVYPRTGFWP